MPGKRTAFFISDRTGITVEMLGHSLLVQFDLVRFIQVTEPFVDTAAKARAMVERINRATRADGLRAIVFCTFADPAVGAIVRDADALVIDSFQQFIVPLEQELGMKASHRIGRAHDPHATSEYHRRIEAIEYTRIHDDWESVRDLDKAETILVGVSRCGKTPTSLYLAMQYGVRAANRPFSPEDLRREDLPVELKAIRNKLYGLTIQPERLQKIRTERVEMMQKDRSEDWNYPTIANCEFEVRQAEALMRQHRIPFIDATSKSIEEIAATIMRDARLERYVY